MQRGRRRPLSKSSKDVDVNLFKADHPEQFPLATAVAHDSYPELVVTGAVNPDVSRNVPVISLVSGRIVSIHARLGDTVKKGQLLLTVRSDDVAGGFSNYRKALADEVLSRTQLQRAQDLYDHGAIALADLQVDAGHRRQSQDRRRDHGRTPAPDRQRPRPSERHGRNLLRRYRV